MLEDVFIFTFQILCLKEMHVETEPWHNVVKMFLLNDGSFNNGSEM